MFWRMAVFKSSILMEEKYDCLLDVVWSALHICHLNFEVVKIILHLLASFPPYCPTACEFSVYGGKDCFTSLRNNLTVELRLMVADKHFNNQPCVVL